MSSKLRSHNLQPLNTPCIVVIPLIIKYSSGYSLTYVYLILDSEVGLDNSYTGNDAPIIGSAYRILAYQPYFLNIGISFTSADIADMITLTQNELLSLLKESLEPEIRFLTQIISDFGKHCT